MVYLKQASIYEILIPRHNMNVANILHISFPRLNPREIVYTSVESEEMKNERMNVREARKVGARAKVSWKEYSTLSLSLKNNKKLLHTE